MAAFARADAAISFCAFSVVVNFFYMWRGK